MSRVDEYDQYMDEIYSDLDRQEELRLAETASLVEENEKLCGIINSLLKENEALKEKLTNVKLILGGKDGDQ